MSKYLIVIAVVIAGYFFLKDPAPSQVHINGQEYGPKLLDKTNDSLSKIFNYRNKAANSDDYVSILYRDSGTSDLLSWSETFVDHFTSLGFKFESSGANKKGIKDNTAIYIVPHYEQDVLLMYISPDMSKISIPVDSGAFDAISKIRMN